MQLHAVSERSTAPRSNAPICKHIVTTGWEEFACGVTGASVTRGCATPALGLCLPRKGLMVRAGTLRLDELPADERKVVMRMAEQIKANAVGDIEQMSDEQLDAMIARAKELKRARWALMKRLPSIERQRDKLIARRNALQKRIGELQQTIDGIREGKQVEVPAGPLKGRKLGPLSPAQLAQRHKAAERMRAARAAKAAKRKQEQAA